MTSRTSRTPADVALGASPSESVITVNAVRLALPASTDTVVEEIPITLITSAAGEALTIVSSSAADVGVVLRLSLLGASPCLSRAALTRGSTP